jgi:hypothetical protein
MKDNSRMETIKEKESLFGQIKRISTKEISEMGKCMDLEHSKMLMEYLKENISLDYLKGKQLLNMQMEISIQGSL